MKKKIEYLWHINNDNFAQFWAKGGIQKYLSTPTICMPKKFITKNNNITAPTPLPFDVLVFRSILNAGYTIHPTGYYHSREIKKYSVLMFILNGKLSVKIDDKNYTLTKGNVLVVPSGSKCDESVKNGNAVVYWLHIANSNEWNFGNKAYVFSPKSFDNITHMLTMYLEEVYSPKRSIMFLENIADVIAELLKRTFGHAQARLSRAELDEYVDEIIRTPSKNWNRISAAKHFKCPPNTLDKICSKFYGATFSKIIKNIRIKKTLEFIESGEKNYAKIAEKVGYANVSSLSKAFKAERGKSLRNILK